uniref:HTH_Tnp_ISL3 domain-containing protein n=1 Tax=Steinernema glaseri TaxID=37863 RepID=A0A1I7ZJ40_9BILA
MTRLSPEDATCREALVRVGCSRNTVRCDVSRRQLFRPEMTSNKREAERRQPVPRESLGSSRSVPNVPTEPLGITFN